MADVKRRYDTTKRREQARRTRRRILEAGREALLEHGYADTTLASVAERAGVAAPTVYKAFGNKAGLVKAVFDVAVAGDDASEPLLRRERADRIRREPDPVRKIELYADGLIGTLERAGRLQLIARAAAEGKAEMRPVWEQMQHERLVGMAHLARILGDGGHLARDVDVEEARDVLWAHTSPELYELLVVHRGWPAERYRDWIVRALVGSLLP
jgi:AcrR family transcriptional regulator